MSIEFNALLRELERVGAEHDRVTADRSRCMLNITRDTGEFLAVLVRAMNARRVLEIGTSNGYSTLWLARAVEANGGQVTTVERSAAKRELARSNFGRSGLDARITLMHEEAGRTLEQAGEASWDFIFLDADRAQYPDWWLQLKRILRPGGLLVVDNATSHPAEMAPFLALVRSDAQFSTSLTPPDPRNQEGREERKPGASRCREKPFRSR